MKGLRTFAAATALVALLGACQQADQPAAEEAATADAGEMALPVSLNALMVGMIDHSSDYIFAIGNGDMPKDDHDWNLIRNHAYQMIASGKVIQIAGTGPNDAEWVRNPEWIRYSNELTQIGEQALQLAEAKNTDQEVWMQVGNDLVDNCIGCHEAFKPELPTGGIGHEATRRESEGASIFD
jgi:hypothetical protein